MTSIKLVNQRMIRGYKLLRKIGSGATAEVFEAEKDEQEFALKVFKEVNQRSMQAFNREVSYAEEVPQGISARLVESFIESIDNKPVPCIAYELAPNGDLLSYIKSGAGPLPVPVMKFYAKQLISSLSAMHK